MKAYPPYELEQIRDLRHLMNLRADSAPDETAFFYTADGGETKKVSYRTFREDVRGLGTWLLKNGSGREHIAILGSNSYEWIAGFFAVTTTGNVAVPLDARQPLENLISIMQMGEARKLVYSREFAPLIPAFEKEIAGFSAFPMEEMGRIAEEGRALLEAGDLSYEERKLDPDTMCALVYTSGTTGIPKGVMLSQRNIAANINQACANFVLEGVGMSVLPFHHMFGLVVGALMVFNYGYPCYICRQIRNIARDFQIAKPECLFVVPMVIESFAKMFRGMGRKAGGNISPEAVRAFTGGSLRYIICGGAPLSVSYVKMFRMFGLEILNGYGITECSPVLAVNRNEDMRDGSVGPVLFGCEVKIADDGEILARGDNVMLGYYKNPEETEKALSGGWFHTGDLGRIEDHYLFVTGRTKNLIITSNGENISPEELEEKLLADPAVAEALVFDADGVLAAEIYPEAEANLPESYFKALIERIGQGEPAYRKIQKLSLRNQPFERNSTGKILRRKNV
ncbi:MAG: AMP-binding protein [Lachnospiraceae bacterium]|nr:AMP-binding protein [Lachnospiraceae bacterium]